MWIKGDSALINTKDVSHFNCKVENHLGDYYTNVYANVNGESVCIASFAYKELNSLAKAEKLLGAIFDFMSMNIDYMDIKEYTED